ncbi:DegT/DnrJ/EryC1/StrS family aminotransferase [Cohnella soli]|uniref:DegT/DnrJ/EryC1/StrS family aminotransferase n=1 Tax=Cohnella soli TaxID=425005 RepID=A0ABW0HME6_9BACL
MQEKQQSRIHLSPPHIGEKEQLYVREAFTTNWVAPLGPNVEAFERETAAHVGSKGALALNSGTSAIHLALRLAGVGSGDTVFVSSLTFVASVNPALYLGAEPVLIDSDPATWNMSVPALERAFTRAARAGKLPKAIIVVNLYGQSADMDPIMALSARYGVPVIEDAAESLGATYKGRASGTIGHYGIYSFNGNKIITTSGGGMLVAHDESALERARYWATQAREPEAHYEHTQLGYNYRLSNVLAGVGRGQLELLGQRVEARRAIYQRYEEAFAGYPGIAFMPEADYGQATRWLTALTVDPETAGVTARELIEALAERNIEARPVWKPMHLQPLMQGCAYYPHEEGESVSDRLFAQGLCLPSGSSMTEKEQNRVIDCLLDKMKGWGLRHESA